MDDQTFRRRIINLLEHLRGIAVVLLGVGFGLAGGCGKPTDVESTVNVAEEPNAPIAVEQKQLEFDGRDWTPTEDMAFVRAIFVPGRVHVGDKVGERLVYAVDESAESSAAREVYQIERQFGREWLASGPTLIVAANGDRDELRFWKGEPSGEQQHFRADGTRWKRVNFHLGKLHGPVQIWHDNGQIWEDHVYSNGKPLKERFFRSDGTELK